MEDQVCIKKGAFDMASVTIECSQKRFKSEENKNKFCYIAEIAGTGTLLASAESVSDLVGKVRNFIEGRYAGDQVYIKVLQASFAVPDATKPRPYIASDLVSWSAQDLLTLMHGFTPKHNR